MTPLESHMSNYPLETSLRDINDDDEEDESEQKKMKKDLKPELFEVFVLTKRLTLRNIIVN